MCKRKKLWIILTIPIIAIVAIVAYIQLYSNCEITISAGFQVPRWDDGINVKTIYPAQNAEWAKESHEVPFTPIRITNGNLKCSVGYGPIEIKGVFPYAEIKKIWPDAPIDNDWIFWIVLFNCHVESSGYHMYCDVQVDTKTSLCTADLYIFINGFTNPDIAHWEGTIGEEIVLRTDF